MQFKVLCTGCNKRFLVDEQAIASGTPCPSCRKSLASAQRIDDSAPAPARAAPAAASSFWDEVPSTAGRVGPLPPLGYRSPTAGTPWHIVLPTGGVILALVVAGVWFFLQGDRKETAAKSTSAQVPANTTRMRRAEESAPAVAVASPVAVDVVAETPNFSPKVPGPPAADVTKLSAKPEEKAKPRVKMAVADLIDAVDDGVVHITVHDADGDPFATGSGFVIERRKVDEWIEPVVKTEQPPMKGDLWLVATNYHVIAGASSVTVRMRDGRTFKPRGLAAHDGKRDLAILALDQAPDNLTILKPAPDSSFRQGEDVVAIGHPKGFDFTVSTGIISAIRGSKELPEEVAESIEAPADQQWVQTTAAITNGNSGGPLLTMYGEVVGINTWGINSGGNLAFASHVKHIVEMHGKCIETKDKLLTIKTAAFSIAKAAEAPQKIGDRDDWLDTEVREELTRSTARAKDIDWRPATKGDYLCFEATALMLTIAAVYHYDVDEPKVISEAFRKRVWKFQEDVEPINRLALESKFSGTFFFGKVKRVSPTSRRHYWVDLTGRGVQVAVTIPANHPAPKLEVGDDIAVFGVRIGVTEENRQLDRGVTHILAGLVVPVKMPVVPEITALRVAFDLVTHDRTDQGFGENIRKFSETYERVLPLLGKSGIRWQRIELNSEGQQLDAVRFSVPHELHCDLAWSFNGPGDSIGAYGILPVGNFPMWHRLKTFEIRNAPIPALTKEEAQVVHVQGLAGGLLVPGQDYLLWFSFRDALPRKVAIAVRLLPVGSFAEEMQESVGTIMKEGAQFKPEVLAKMTKAMKDKETGASKLPEPTKPSLEKTKTEASETPAATTPTSS